MTNSYLSLKELIKFLAKHRITFDGKTMLRQNPQTGKSVRSRRYYVYLNYDGFIEDDPHPDLTSAEATAAAATSSRLAMGYIDDDKGIGLVKFNDRFLRLFPIFEFIQLRRLNFSRRQGSDIELAFTEDQSAIIQQCLLRNIDISTFLTDKPEPMVVQVNMRATRQKLNTAANDAVTEAGAEGESDESHSEHSDLSYAYQIREIQFPNTLNSGTNTFPEAGASDFNSSQFMHTPDINYNPSEDSATLVNPLQNQDQPYHSQVAFTSSPAVADTNSTAAIAATEDSEQSATSTASLTATLADTTGHTPDGAPPQTQSDNSALISTESSALATSSNANALATEQEPAANTTLATNTNTSSTDARATMTVSTTLSTTDTSPNTTAPGLTPNANELNTTFQALSQLLHAQPQLKSIDPQVIAAATLSTLGVLQALQQPQTEEQLTSLNLAPSAPPETQANTADAKADTKAKVKAHENELIPKAQDSSSLAASLEQAPASGLNPDEKVTKVSEKTASKGAEKRADAVAGNQIPNVDTAPSELTFIQPMPWLSDPEIEVKILDERLKNGGFPLPDYATASSAGMDLRAMIEEELILQPQECRLIPTGIAMFIKNPYLCATVLPRSGLGYKHGIVLGNLTGLIDADYQGPLMVPLWNRSNTPFKVAVGERIAQMVLLPIVRGHFKVVDEFEKTQRSTGGFGSTGTK